MTEPNPLAALAAAVLVAACGSQDPAPGDGDGADAGPPDAGGPAAVDAAPRGDARLDCPVPLTYGGVTPIAPTASSQAGGSLLATAGLVAAPAADQLIVSLVKGRGPFIDGPVVGDFPLAGDMLDNDSCALCVRLTAGGEDYFATGGLVKITSVTGTLAFQLLDVRLGHVSIATTPPFAITPIQDGCTTRISSLTFAAPIMLMP